MNFQKMGGGTRNALKERYLVPPFSIIYGNKPEWLARKRMWVKFGIRSELGRGGQLVFQFPRWMARGAQDNPESMQMG